MVTAIAGSLYYRMPIGAVSALLKRNGSSSTGGENHLASFIASLGLSEKERHRKPKAQKCVIKQKPGE